MAKSRDPSRHWWRDLWAHKPEGVPLEEDGHLATFGDLVNGQPVHQADEGEGYCFQCCNCRWFVPLSGKLGLDWGACLNPASQYDRSVTFEHWTCAAFAFGNGKYYGLGSYAHWYDGAEGRADKARVDRAVAQASKRMDEIQRKREQT